MHQIESVKLVSRAVDITMVVSPAKLTMPFTAPLISGDLVFLGYLFDILYLNNKNQPLTVTVEERQTGYVVLHILMSALHLSDEVCRDLFQPSADRLMFFICRQIARDNGEATNRRGCGISATETPDGIMVDVVLSKAN